MLIFIQIAMLLLLFLSNDDLSLNYLYVAVTVAIQRWNRKDLAVVSIAVTMGGMQNRNKVSENTYLYSNCDVAIVVGTKKRCCCFLCAKAMKH